jgi:hypothetical protein
MGNSHEEHTVVTHTNGSNRARTAWDAAFKAEAIQKAMAIQKAKACQKRKRTTDGLSRRHTPLRIVA